MLEIEIGTRNYLLYLLLPHGLKMRLLTSASRQKLDRINLAGNERAFAGEAASAYDELHRYTDADPQQVVPTLPLVTKVWPGGGYGRALELGAGTGFYTVEIARHATSVLAVEPIADFRRLVDARCAEAGITNVRVVGGSAYDPGLVPEGSIDTALILHSLHHFHRRPEVFAALGRAVRPGGRLFLVEPHHNVRRAARLLRKYLKVYRAPEFRANELNWATHDFVTRGEMRSLCRDGGFEDVRISAYWIPYARRLVPAAQHRFVAETIVGRLPVVRHFGAVLALEARRSAQPVAT